MARPISAPAAVVEEVDLQPGVAVELFRDGRLYRHSAPRPGDEVRGVLLTGVRTQGLGSSWVDVSVDGRQVLHAVSGMGLFSMVMPLPLPVGTPYSVTVASEGAEKGLVAVELEVFWNYVPWTWAERGIRV